MMTLAFVLIFGISVWVISKECYYGNSGFITVIFAITAINLPLAFLSFGIAGLTIVSVLLVVVVPFTFLTLENRYANQLNNKKR